MDDLPENEIGPAWNYKGDWDELMDEAKPIIKDKVKRLKLCTH